LTTTNDEKLATKKAALRAKRSGDTEAKTTKLLRFYRISAWIVGLPLAALFLVAMPMKYFGDNGTPVTVIGIAHGWLYMIYIACTALLATHRRWSIGRTVLVVLGGTVPLLSFWTEHVVHKKVKADEPGW
jgi:integral membrane protein